MEQKMTLIERLRNPAYVTNPAGGDALLDTTRAIADMREAADRLEDAAAALGQPDKVPM